jgi:uncharacterized protein with GYD domain
MEHYLLRLSYTSAGWHDIVDKAADFDGRLGPVRQLIAQLGGSFASFHFYESGPADDYKRKHVVVDKFAMFGGHDLMAVLAMPDKNAAQAFRIALSKQAGIQTIDLDSIMPFEDAITKSVSTAKDVMGKSGYAGPGPTSP